MGHALYTAQVNAYGNVIVCKGSIVRRGYTIAFSSSYADCLAFKVRHTVAAEPNMADSFDMMVEDSFQQACGL